MQTALCRAAKTARVPDAITAVVANAVVVEALLEALTCKEDGEPLANP